MKQKILDAGLTIWREQGVENVKLRQIAEALKVTHPGILYYFPTMTALKDAIAEHAVEKRDTKVMQLLLVTGHRAVSHLTDDQRERCLLGDAPKSKLPQVP